MLQVEKANKDMMLLQYGTTRSKGGRRGGIHGGHRRGLRVPAHDVMAECPRPPARMVVLGDDMLWDLDLAAVNARG